MSASGGSTDFSTSTYSGIHPLGRIAMMIKQLQPPHNLLLAAAKQSDELMGTDETMPVDEPDDFAVALRELNRSNRENASETG